MTQAISTLTWQEQSDSSQPLANYTLAFGTDPIWSFQLPSTYHFAPINPRGVTVDNSQGAGTINLVSAGFTVNVLPYSREDIDLSNVSQLITFNFQQTVGQPTIAPYSLPIVFWMKKPSGAQQNQLAINTAVQSAIVGSVLGNMQPVINSGFTEWPTGVGPFVIGGAPVYFAEGWMVSTTAGNWQASQAPNPFAGAANGFKLTGSGAATAQVTLGTALTTADSIQYQGQQLTVAVDLNMFLQTGGNVLVSLVGGTGTDQNIFAPFTAVQTLASLSVPSTSASRRVSVTMSGTVPNNVKQIGILIQYNPPASVLFDNFTVSRPQIDVGTIAQQFRTVPQIMERDRCLGFFEKMNLEGVAGEIYGTGYSNDATLAIVMINYVRKRAIPIIAFTGPYNIVRQAGTTIAVSSITATQIGQSNAIIRPVVAGGMAGGEGIAILDSGGTSNIIINARM